MERLGTRAKQVCQVCNTELILIPRAFTSRKSKSLRRPESGEVNLPGDGTSGEVNLPGPSKKEIKFEILGKGRRPKPTLTLTTRSRLFTRAKGRRPRLISCEDFILISLKKLGEKGNNKGGSARSQEGTSQQALIPLIPPEAKI